MSEFIASIFGNVWGTALMSVVPLIELKGGIVFARSVGFDFWTAFILSYAGSTAVFFAVFFLLKPILNLLKKIKLVGRFAEKIENYFNEKAERTLKERENGDKRGLSERALKMLGVFIFVAIPLPLTGVWTGTAVAVFLNLKFKDAVLPVIVGNIVAGVLISLLAELFLALYGSTAVLDYVLWGLFGLALVLFIITLIRIVGKRDKIK